MLVVLQRILSVALDYDMLNCGTLRWGKEIVEKYISGMQTTDM
jgi:hypothetical protein